MLACLAPRSHLLRARDEKHSTRERTGDFYGLKWLATTTVGDDSQSTRKTGHAGRCGGEGPSTSRQESRRSFIFKLSGGPASTAGGRGADAGRSDRRFVMHAAKRKRAASRKRQWSKRFASSI